MYIKSGIKKWRLREGRLRRYRSCFDGWERVSKMFGALYSFGLLPLPSFTHFDTTTHTLWLPSDCWHLLWLLCLHFWGHLVWHFVVHILCFCPIRLTLLYLCGAHLSLCLFRSYIFLCFRHSCGSGDRSLHPHWGSSMDVLLDSGRTHQKPFVALSRIQFDSQFAVRFQLSVRSDHHSDFDQFCWVWLHTGGPLCLLLATRYRFLHVNCCS